MINVLRRAHHGRRMMMSGLRRRCGGVYSSTQYSRQCSRVFSSSGETLVSPAAATYARRYDYFFFSKYDEWTSLLRRRSIYFSVVSTMFSCFQFIR